MNKSNLVKIVTVLFFLVGILDMVGLILDDAGIRSVFKPLIIPTLALVYVFSVKKINWIYILALVFSFLGDVFLLNKSGNFFLYGLCAFLITHVAYIFILGKNINKYKLKTLLIASIPYLLTVGFILLIIKNNLGELLVPVTIYGIVVATFGALAFYNYLEKRNGIALLLFLGAFLFVVSDGVIAVERFLAEHKELELGLSVMGTYIVAQYLICLYMIKKQENTI